MQGIIIHHISVLPPPPNQALMLTFTHCDKQHQSSGPFTRRAHVIAAHIKGVRGGLLWLHGVGVRARNNRENR